MPGVHNPKARNSLLEQLIDSVHRVSYPVVLCSRTLSSRRTNPADELFDPLMAAILQHRQGNIEEAFWLIFLFVHFGKHRMAGWRYAREVYGRLGQGPSWDWNNTSGNPKVFRQWLNSNRATLERPGIPRGFGNHRKYVSLDAITSRGTGAAVDTYVAWIGPPRTHSQLFEQAIVQASGDPVAAFDHLYQSMATVASFGRLARFDLLCMVGQLGLAKIKPGSTYLQGSTGPLHGARRLFGVPSMGPSVLEIWLRELDTAIGVGSQALEDALCNWHKSPLVFKPFRP